MSIPDRQLIATDDLCVRDRTSRNLLLGGYIAAVPFIFSGIGAKITNDWFDTRAPGFYIGLAAASLVVGVTVGRFLIRNKSLHSFVTVDLLQSFLSGEDVYVTYGPGLHAAFPWESRSADDNISLDEAEQDFEVTVQCLSGIVTVNGSLRMRPDIRFSIPFLSGTAVMASDVVDLVKSFIIELLAGKEVDEALVMVATLNTELNKKFGLASQGVSPSEARHSKDPQVSEFERRFGVNIGDITIAKILPSKEAQKTRNAIDEARVISKGTLIILNMKDEDELNEALRNGMITRDDVTRARREFMAASDNITMNLGANEYTLKLEGDAEVLKALAAASPAILTYLQRQGGGGNPKKKSGS